MKQTPWVNRRQASVALAVGATGGIASLTACAPHRSSATASLPRAEHDPFKPLKRIAYGSCADQSRDQPVWATILADRPDLMIFGGDNVYASTPPWSEAQLRRAYAQLLEKPQFARLLSEVPHMEIWDDHDFGQNDGGASWAEKETAKRHFLDFFQAAPLDPRRSREGLYREQLFGPEGQRVQIIMLDGRWFRSDLKPTDARGAAGKERYLSDSDASKTMLGAEQWAWLEERLRMPADVRLIVSGVQVLAEGHGWESWGNFPNEREKLVQLIGSTRANGVVFLSGDRHIGGYYRRARADRGAPYALTELTSSGLTHAWADAKEAGPNRIGELVTKNHYASIEMDWSKRQIALLIKGTDGQCLRSETLQIDQLKA